MEKNLGGRPVKYTTEFIEKEADAFLKWIKVKENVYFKEFALERGYHPNRLGEFSKSNYKFSGVYGMAQAYQEVKLVKGGLNNKYNAFFTKLVLCNTCGWSEKQQVSGDVKNPLAILLEEIDGSTKELVDE